VRSFKASSAGVKKVGRKEIMRLRLNRWSRRRHPWLAAIAAATSFLFILIPQWAASAWTLFSNEPLPVWMAREHFPNFPFSPLWVTGPIGTVLLIMILLSIRSDKHKVELGQSDKRRATPVAVLPKDPQPAVVAVDELNELLNQGERLVSRFQIDSVKPTFSEVEEWRQKAHDRARQNVLANFVGPKDLAKFDTPWDEPGHLVGLAVLKHLCGAVDRLKKLITKIEGEDLTHEKPVRLDQLGNYNRDEAVFVFLFFFCTNFRIGS
jgi:hypothetical protein